MWRLCIVGCKWGISHWTRGRGMGDSARSQFISFPSFGFLCGFLLLFTFLPLYFFHFLGAGSTEKGGHPMGGSPEIRNGGTVFGGLWLGEDGSDSGRLRGGGFYGLLRGAMSHSSISTAPPSNKKVHHTPSATISCLSPQESKEPEVPGPAEQVLESTSSTSPSVLGGEIPAIMQPLCIQLGVSRGYTDVRLRVAGRAHQPLMPPFVHMCIRYIKVNKWWVGGSITLYHINHPHLYYISLQSPSH